MADYRLNLDTLNAISAQLGGGDGHLRETAALNAICTHLGGTGGHVRTLAGLNEWATRIGDAGGHRRSVAAANAIARRLGGTGGHRRTLAALDEIAARLALPDTITSGSVRAQMMVGQSGTYAGGERATHRLRDRSNVAVARPWLEFFHGRVLSSGVVDTELETGLASGVTARYRAALLTGISGTAKNQTGASVHRATFLGMREDAAFLAAGGAVSADGLTVTVPNGWRFRSDRLELSLAAGEEYFVQTECIAASGAVAPNPRGRACIPALGDLTFNEAAGSTADTVFKANWSAVWNASPTSAFGPIAVLGSGSAPLVIVDGDSIIADLAAPGTGANGTEAGDAFGVKNFAKRALNARGYAFLDVSVPGSNVGNFMAGYGRSGLRAGLMKYGRAVITDHLHNDRRSTVAFAATAGWSETNRAPWNSTGLRTRYAWHNDWLRTRLAPGARIVRCTLVPYTSSTDGWTSTSGQTGRNDDAVWAADYATGAAGDQFKLNDLIMRRGAYAGLAYGTAGEPDAAFDLYAAVGGTADGKWPAGGTTDGTHPSETLQAAAAAVLAAKLPALLGF
jgi:hypothetical protein